MTKETITAIILCYHKFDFIYDAILSVLEQDYESIELIISDDGSPHFPEDDIRAFIQKNKKANIVNAIYNHETENIGTVKHLNHAISLANGDYIMALAADDLLFDKSVLRNYVVGFKKAGKDCYIEMAQTAMCDYDMEKTEGYYLQPQIREILEDNRKGDSSNRLFSLLACKAYLPSTSTCFKKEFFSKFGKFDERYVLVEDIPMHLRLARESWEIHYENFIAIKHRTGGISHGNTDGLSKSKFLYLNDLLNIRQNEIIPYYYMIDPSILDDVKNVAYAERLWAKSQLHLYQHSRKLHFDYIKEFWPHIVKMHFLNNRWKFLYLSHFFFKKSVIMLVLAPIVKYVMEMLLLGMDKNTSGLILSFCYGISFLMLGISVVYKSLEIVGTILAKIESFPDETLIIG